MKRIGAVLAALVFAILTSLSAITDASALVSGEILDIEGDNLPDNLVLAYEEYGDGDERTDAFAEFYFGNKKEEYYQDTYNVMMTDYESEEEANQAWFDYYLRYGIVLMSIGDLYLTEGEGGQRYEYDGGKISLRLHVTDLDDAMHGMMNSFGDEYEVKPLVIHGKHDGSFEYVDYEYNIESNELKLTLDSLSPLLVAIKIGGDEEEAAEAAPVKTLDNIQISASVAAISVAGLVGLGAWVAKKETR